jgi:hypothetical protein
MYSKTKVDWRLDIAERNLGWRAQPKPLSDVLTFEDHLKRYEKYTYDDLGKPTGTQNLNTEESRWIQNEQVMVQCDASYFLARYSFIKDIQNNIIRFDIRIPQKLLFDIICDLEERDSSVEVQILKARQLGCSTIVELLIAHRIIFGYGVNAIIGSADQTKTRLMANMLFLCYDNLPVWLRPKWTRRVESDRGMLVFGHSSSGVSFQHGAQTSGIARGTTPTIYHLSECASFTDPLNQIEASLFKAVHASPSVFGILESTGEGNEGWWAKTWYGSKSKWDEGRSRLCPLFLPWYCGTHIWPTETWTRDHPVPTDWLPHKDTVEHVAKAHLYVRSNELLSKHLGHEWRMPMHQQWFWEVEHEEAKEKGPEAEATFFQEMAGDDEEALQRSSESVFGHTTIEMVDANRSKQFECFTITGQSIEDSHEVLPDHFDYQKERIPVVYQSSRQTSRWELIPLKSVKMREDQAEDAESVLCIWDHPKPGHNYAIGMDTARGQGQDSTCISVWAVGYGNLPDIQVAEFASSWVSHVESWAFCLCVAAYYAKHMKEGQTRWHEPYVTIEQVEAVGDVAQSQMAIHGYKNFHKFSRIDSTPRKIAKQKKAANKLGWYTWGWSRPLLIDPFVHWSRYGWAKINSPWLLEEMRHFEVHSTARGKPRLEHEAGFHDDRIFAAALSIFPPHDVQTMAHRSKNRIDMIEAMPKLDLSEYKGMTIPASQLTEKRPFDWQDLLYYDTRGRYSSRRL